LNDVVGSAGGDASPLHFTGKQRDSESTLDYFGARYYSSGQGRFMTPDYEDDDDESPYPMANASISNPQTLNLYGYVENNPANKADPDGHASWGLCQNDPAARCYNGDYNGERNCDLNDGCLFWSSNSGQWEANDPTRLNPSDLPGWWFTGFVRLTLGDPYGFKQMGYAYAKLALLPFGGWNLLKPPGAGASQAGGRPSIVPDGWVEKMARKGNGRVFYDPSNPYNSVRVMEDGFMRVRVNGHYVDVNGNEVLRNSPDAHIPIDTPMESPFGTSAPIEPPIID
jgi:RHS repeat-associated protein